MNTNVKTCLFGGALLGAGLCSSASAADVNWNSGFGYAHDRSIFAFSDDTGPYATWNADTGTGAHARAGRFGFDMAVDAINTPYSYAFASAFGSFSVATDTTLSLSWDLGNTYSYISVLDSSNAHILSVLAGDSGSLEFTFLANESYSIAAVMRESLDGASSFSMSDNNVNVVPLPPAAFAGLGMLAGLGAYRRIRK